MLRVAIELSTLVGAALLDQIRCPGQLQRLSPITAFDGVHDAETVLNHQQAVGARRKPRLAQHECALMFATRIGDADERNQRPTSQAHGLSALLTRLR